MGCIFFIIVAGIALEKEENIAMDPELAALCEQCSASVSYQNRESCAATEEVTLHWSQEFPPLPAWSTPENLSMNEKWLICVGLGVISSVLLTEPFIIFIKTCLFVLVLPCLKAIWYILTCQCSLLFPPEEFEDDLKLPDQPELSNRLQRQRSNSNIGNQHMYWFFTGELSEHISDQYTPGPPGTQLANAANLTTPGERPYESDAPARLSKRLSKAEVEVESHRLANQDFKRMSQILSDEDLLGEDHIREARESKNLKKLSAMMSRSQAQLIRMDLADDIRDV